MIGRERRDQLRRERELIAAAFSIAPVRLAVGVALTAITGLLPVAFVVAASALIAHAPAAIRAGSGSHAWRTEELYLAALLGFFFAQQLAAPLGEVVRTGIAGRVDGVMRERLMAAAALPDGIAAFEDEAAVDAVRDAVDRLRLRTWGPGAAAAAFLPLARRYVQAVAGAVLVSVAVAWWAGLAVLASGVVIRTGYRRCGARFFRAEAGYARARRRRSYTARLMFSGEAAKEIRVFGLLRWLLSRHEQLALAVVQPLWRLRRETFLTPFISYGVISFAVLAAAFAYSADDAARGVLTLGGLALVLQVGFTGVQVLGGYFANSDTQIYQGMLAFDAVRRSESLLAARVHTGEAALPAGVPREAIRFERVGFSYEQEGAAVFSGLDLTVPAGRSLGIVGVNGAGKTTLVKLLCRLYEPQAGCVTADGIDLRAVRAADWQRRVAVIFQDFVRYEATVAQNVAPRLNGHPADEAAIWRALDQVGARSFVEALPRGLDTVLSRQYEGGSELSGGQWQRLALARALLALDDGARVLVLDEPTANLDVRAEAEMFDRFLEATFGVTTILISHRFSTVRKASSIVVLDGGRAVESGAHAELVAADGLYARLFELQATRFRDAAGEAAP